MIRGMTFLQVLSIVLVALVALFFASRARLYGRLFAPAHYRELADKLPAARTAALERVDEDAGSNVPGDPRVVASAAGLVVFVTIRRDGPVHIHHFSVSVGGGPTADAVGRTFSVFIAERLGWDLGQAAFAVSPRRVFHGEMHLDEAAQDAWAARAVTTPVGEDAHREAMARRNLVSFTAIQLPA